MRSVQPIHSVALAVLIPVIAGWRAGAAPGSAGIHPPRNRTPPWAAPATSRRGDELEGGAGAGAVAARQQLVGGVDQAVAVVVVGGGDRRLVGGTAGIVAGGELVARIDGGV